MKRYLIIFLLFMSVILTISGCGKTYEFQLSPVDDSLTYASNNQISYTSSDGNIVEPNRTNVFGANIISNTYNNGIGVITFDGDVTSIGYCAFSECDSLTSVTIPDSVTEIGNDAFDKCTSLTSVTIGDSVTTIGVGAFYECTSLKSVNIPDSVTSIEGFAFRDCTSLTSVTIGDSVTSIDSVAFFNCDSLTEFNGKFATEDGRSLIMDNIIIAYANASGTTYTIPDSVTTIGNYAFDSCNSLTSVNIPDSVTEIGNNAFDECTNLISVTIPDSVTFIAAMAFRYCDSLTSVYCKATTPPALHWDVFDYNGSGRKIYVPAESVEAYKSATNWNEYASAIVGYDFENGEIVEVLPNNEIWYTSSDGDVVEPNKTNVFGAKIISNKYNNGMGVITFDGDVTTIGEGAFYECTSLTSVNIPDSVTTIGYAAFYSCDSLTSVTIGDSVTTIGEWAFNSCDSLTSVNIPDSVTKIGSYAFRDCTSLTSVNIGDLVTTISGSAFVGCDSLTEFTGKFAEDNGRILVVDGVLTAFAPAGITEYNIPDGVTSIGNNAFYSCDSLTSVNIPDSVTTIGEDAFWGCISLTSVNIPDSVTTIGHGAFDGCLRLTSVNIPDSVTKIGSYAFCYCKGLTSVIIPDSVTTIGSYAFFDCYSLTSVTIGDSVTTIGNTAFYDCTSLTSVYCKATTPPALGDTSVFDYNGSGRKIYVPAESVEAYKSAYGWSEYASAIVGYDF